MTISLSTFPQTTLSRLRHPSDDIESNPPSSEDTQASAFADLLASLLAPHTETGVTPDCILTRQEGLANEQSRQAAALAPSPGAPAEAFSAARLLVDMALVLPGERVAGVAEANVSGPLPTSAAPLAATRPGPDAMARELPEASIAPDLRGILSQRLQPGQSVHLSQLSGILTARELSSVNIGPSMPTGIGTVPARRLSSPLPELPQSRDIPRAIREPLVAAPSGHTSPFGAHLVRTEAGLQLILRVPKLAESERAALEAALSHLLESHGHASVAIVIHEVVKG